MLQKDNGQWKEDERATMDILIRYYHNLFQLEGIKGEEEMMTHISTLVYANMGRELVREISVEEIS